MDKEDDLNPSHCSEPPDVTRKEHLQTSSTRGTQDRRKHTEISRWQGTDSCQTKKLLDKEEGRKKPLGSERHAKGGRKREAEQFDCEILARLYTRIHT